MAGSMRSRHILKGRQRRLAPPSRVNVSILIFSVHHFNLGRRVPGFDYGPDAFGTGLTPLHLSDDGEGGAFHFQEPPPPYAAYKYPDIHHPDDPPPPYEASINPDSLLFVDLGRRSRCSSCRSSRRSAKLSPSFPVFVPPSRTPGRLHGAEPGERHGRRAAGRYSQRPRPNAGLGAAPSGEGGLHR